MFEVITVPAESYESLAPLGTKPKFWFTSTLHGMAAVECLFKEARPDTGEDWAEKMAGELCSLLGLPHVEYELALWKDRRGVVCRNFVPVGGQLVLGNELLVKVVSGYPSTQFHRVYQYTLRRVLALFRMQGEPIQVPIGWEGFAGVTSALDVFIGYLMFDAWIANQDRHHENWGLVITPESTRHLAPSYDHASSLGSIEREKVRQERLTTRDQRRAMPCYVARAKSAFFASPARKERLSTIEAFREAGRIRPVAAHSWLERLADISFSAVQGGFAELPPDRITPVAIEFALKMLELNRQRLVALHEEFR